MELYTLFLLWLAFGVVDTLQTGLLLTQERKYFGSGDLKNQNEVTMTDNHQNISFWFLLSLSRREHRQLKRTIISKNETDIPKVDLVATQHDIEGGLFEGDIKFNTPLLDKVWHLKPKKTPHNRTTRAISRWQSGRWPNATVPYSIDASVGIFTRNRIFRAMQHISARTCIRFVQRNQEQNYVLFEGNSYCCASNIGMQGTGKQAISVRFCDNKGMIIHEICHALGFWHEQSRPDRNRFVRILWENIIPTKRINFVKRGGTEINSLSVSYDLGSIMHFDLHAFSRNGKPTMVVLNRNYTGRIGQRNGLSERDREQLNRMYSCPNRYIPTTPATIRPTTTTTTTNPVYIQTNTPIAFKSADTNQWPLCSGLKCFANGCPGKIFKTKNVKKCPSSIFGLELVGRHAGIGQLNVRNGNLVAIKRLYQGVGEETGAKWLFCERTHCFVTYYCDNNGHFDMSHCHQQVLKIMVEGKATGELLEVNDVIKLQYHDPTTTTTTTSSYFSCFDNKGPIDRCSKQPSCDTNNNNNTNTCQQYRFQINKVPSIP